MTLKTRTHTAQKIRELSVPSLSLFYLLKRRHLVNKKISTSPEGRGDGEGGSREPPLLLLLLQVWKEEGGGINILKGKFNNFPFCKKRLVEVREGSLLEKCFGASFAKAFAAAASHWTSLLLNNFFGSTVLLL